MMGQKPEARVEWLAWQEVCFLLEASGAVTKKDVRLPRMVNDTDGKKLLEAIRQWGNRLVELQQAK